MKIKTSKGYRVFTAFNTLLMVLLILTAAKLLLERLLALMLPHDLHQNTRLLLSMAQEALLVGLPALLMRRGRSARTGTMRLSIGLLLCAAARQKGRQKCSHYI